MFFETLHEVSATFNSTVYARANRSGGEYGSRTAVAAADLRVSLCQSANSCEGQNTRFLSENGHAVVYKYERVKI